jgi:plastocyanin
MRSVFTARVLLALAAMIGCGCGSSGGASSTGTASTPSTSSAPAQSSTSAGPLALAANPSGQLSYSTKSLTANAGGVTIEFTNHSPLPHNLTVASTSGKVLGATPTFQGSSKTLTLNLGPGTYAFYCSVPGHRASGMQGVLVVK